MAVIPKDFEDSRAEKFVFPPSSAGDAWLAGLLTNNNCGGRFSSLAGLRHDVIGQPVFGSGLAELNRPNDDRARNVRTKQESLWGD